MCLYEDSDIQAEREGRISETKEGFETPYYYFKSPIVIKEEGLSLYICYLTDCPVDIIIDYTDSTEKTFNLPVNKGFKIEFLLPVKDGTGLKGFRFKTDSPGGIFKLEEAGIKRFFPGIIFKDDRIIFGQGINIQIVKGNPSEKYIISLDRFFLNMLNRNAQVQIRIEYELKNGADFKNNTEPNYELKIACLSENKIKEYLYIPGKKDKTVYIYSAACGFTPDKLEVKGGRNIIIRQIEIHSFKEIEHLETAPLPADIGAIFLHKPEYWRQKNYELFCWNSFPEVLIFNTLDYKTQSGYFKRLAFFVEKPGFQGSLASNDTINLLHGWNAHDYKAEDLAVFFTRAKEENFILNSKEQELLEILLKNKIVMEENNIFTGGNGAVLSISQETEPRLRRKFLIHESFHGLFFVNKDFREQCFKIWNDLDKPEKEFWHFFLNWRHYNIKDKYLVVNEFMAYNMQQPIENINEYFIDYLFNKIIDRMPEKEEYLITFINNYLDTFTNSAGLIEKAAFEIAGFNAGDLKGLSPLHNR